MFRNFLKISFRNLWKNRLYSLINIVGLAVGLTCVLLVTLFVKDEFSFDKFHAKSPQIFRVTTTLINKEGTQQTVGSSGQVQGPSFKTAVPEVLEFVRLMGVGFNVVGEEKTLNLKGLYTDESFFKVFSFPLLHGNAQNAISGTNTIVLTEKSALKFFGRTDVVGKVLEVKDGSFSQPFVITAVAKDIPSNSSIQFEILVPFKYLEKSFTDDNWLTEYLTTFVLLHPSADPKNVLAKFPAIFAAKAKDQIQETKKAEGYSPHRHFGLQPITDVHLNRMGLEKKTSGGDSGGITNASTLTYSYILIGIVGFILLMACINFVNLSIANSLKRAKEVGVRKITGSTRWQIICQFLCEAAILCLAAFFLALLLSEIILPVFNSFVNKQLLIDNLFDAQMLITWFLLLSISILLAGLYPAFVLSRFKPKEVLYNKFKLSGGHWFGKSLVVFQFSLAICLIVATVVYYSQMDFISKKDLGYDSKNIVRIWIPLENPKQLVGRLKQEFTQHPALAKVATGADNSDPVLGGFPTKINGKEVRYVITEIDSSFLPALNIPIIEGRNFSPAFGGDKKKSAIVNEAFVKAAGLSNPLGQRFENTWGGTDPLTIVGVVKDYHYGSLKDKIHPQVMILQDNLPFFWLKVHEGKRAQAVALLEKTFKTYAPTHPAQYSFLEDDIDSLYRNEKQWQQIINYSAVLSLLICCIGLFGLAHLAAAQRIKEIGVRKVLGASVYSIVSMLSKDVVKLVVIAAVIAFPVAWMAMNNWLQDFAYRIEISWWFFAIAGIAAILIALLTVSFQAIKAAVANPVKSLRTE